jgi:hypothetical protein
VKGTAIFATPRPIPNRLVPVLAGGGVIALALPVFLVAGWPVRAWALAAVLWVAGQAFGLLLTRPRLGADNLAASGVVGIGTMFRPIAVMVVVIAVAASDATLGLAAGLLYALAYTAELGVGLALYFGGEAR